SSGPKSGPVSGGDSPICDQGLGAEPELSVVGRAVGRIGRIGEDRPRDRRGGQDRGVALYLISRHSSMPTSPPSRPRPDIFTPPEGAPGFETRPEASRTRPAWSVSARRSARSRFSLNR